MRIKRRDNVIIISGKDKGKSGKVTKALPRENAVVIDGANMKKKHQKPRRSGQKGQVVEFAAPIHVSNVQILDPKGGKPTRIGYKTENGKKVRVAKKSGAVI